jgi:hypothetical protein
VFAFDRMFGGQGEAKRKNPADDDRVHGRQIGIEPVP